MLDSFRSGRVNTLVATSVAEEGLDIGSVDLIVCFDVQQSSLRMVQRMGRTGRKRNGKVVVLLVPGVEDKVSECRSPEPESFILIVKKIVQLHTMFFFLQPMVFFPGTTTCIGTIISALMTCK